MTIENLFSNPVLVRVLSQFFLHPESSFYQRQLVVEVKAALVQVQRALSRLEKSWLITKSREGNRFYYTANCSHPAFEDLKRAFFKTIIFGEMLKKSLHPLKNKIFFAFIYGSFARSEETKESDIDLFIVGSLKTREIASLLGPVIRETNVEINPVAYPLSECQKRWCEQDHFLKHIVQGSKIWLIGSEDAFRKAVEGRETSSTSNISRRNPKSSQGGRARFKRCAHTSTLT